MSNENNLAPHEILELRELMDTTIIGIKKMQASIPMVEDDELKSFMERCIDNKNQTINSMQKFIESNLNIQ